MTVEYTVAPSTGGTVVAQYREEAGGTNGFPLSNVGSVGACLNFDVRKIYPVGFWRGISGDGLTGGNYDITLVGHNLDLAVLCSITAIKRPSESDPWEQNGTHVEVTGALDSAIVKRTGASSWSDWAFGGKDDAFFPVTWLYFSASADNDRGDVTLRWATGSEEQHSHFEVERSSNLADWTTLESVNGQGAVGVGATYEIVDDSPMETNYYRIRSVDLDGSYSFSDVQVARFEAGSLQANSRVYPNPSLGNITIEYPGNGWYNVFDMTGRLLAEGELQHQATIDGLSKGIYLLLLSGENGTATHRVVILE